MYINSVKILLIIFLAWHVLPSPCCFFTSKILAVSFLQQMSSLWIWTLGIKSSNALATCINQSQSHKVIGFKNCFLAATIFSYVQKLTSKYCSYFHKKSYSAPSVNFCNFTENSREWNDSSFQYFQLYCLVFDRIYFHYP